MSLLANPLTGHEMADVAALEADGLWYRCFVWRNKAQGRIEARCFVEQAHGQPSLVFESILATDPEDGFVESPKIIAVGVTFVVHYISSVVSGEDDVTAVLHRSTMNMEAFDASVSGWTAHGSAGLHDHHLYDACSIMTDAHQGVHATDFIVVRKTANDTLTTQRFDGFEWVDTDWSTATTRTAYRAVLACYANDVDGDVVVSYMKEIGGDPEDDGLWTYRLDANTGGNFVESETFPEFDDASWLQVGYCRVAANTVAVVAEAVDNTLKDTFGAVRGGYAALHDIVYRTVSSRTSNPESNAHWASNLYMCSHPWSYVDGASGRSVYVLASYKSVNEPGDSPRVPANDTPDAGIFAGPQASDWDQAYFFALNLDFDQWDVVIDGADLRPRPVGTIYTTGIPDARPSRISHGAQTEPNVSWQAGLRVGKRMNHLSHASPPPSAGPDVKTRTIAAIVYATMRVQAFGTESSGFVAEGTELMPENAGVAEIKVHLEDPWSALRNGENGGDPFIPNFKGANSRAICHAVEAGKGTFFAGGTPYYYDGRHVVECGFPWRPEMVVAAISNGTGLLSNDATYQVYFCWSWRDAAGQVHRSGPSAIYTIATGASDDTAEYVIRSLTISLKDATAHYPMAPAIQCEVFRTTDGGTLFYRVFGSSSQDDAADSSPDSTPVNDPTVHTFNISDGVSDAALVLQGLGPYQYATDSAGNITGFPDVLVQTPPAMHAVCTWLNRIWGADSCDEAVIWYSDEILPDYGSDFYQAPTFNDSQTFRIGEVGEIVALQPMNNDLIVFTTDAIYALTIQQDLGSGLLNVASQVLHEGTGCIEPRSVVLAPPGIFFQSAKGYYLLGRGRELSYNLAGEAVVQDIIDAGNIRAATLLEDRHQIRLVCNGRPVRTWTTTVTLAGDAPTGGWEISAGGVDMNFTATPVNTFAEIADGLLADYNQEGPSEIIASVTAPGDTVVIVWEPSDDEPSYTTTAPAGNTASGVDTYEDETYPRVLIYDYRVGQWSRAELVQTHANARMSETMDGCAWRGLYDATTAHVVLAQGALLVERGPSDSLAYTDQTSVGNVGIPIDITTAWQAFAGPGGSQRVRSALVVAKKTEETEFSVDVDTVIDGDYDNPTSETGLAVASVSPAMTRVRPTYQKGTAHRVRVYEDVGVQNTENIRVTAIVFEVGIRKGHAKLADSQVGV